MISDNTDYSIFNFQQVPHRSLWKVKAAMAVKTWVFAFSSFFHDLFTVIWMGGLVVTVLSYMPALKEALGPGPQIKKVMMAFQKRQSIWVNASMGGSILTVLFTSGLVAALAKPFSG